MPVHIRQCAWVREMHIKALIVLTYSAIIELPYKLGIGK